MLQLRVSYPGMHFVSFRNFLLWKVRSWNSHSRQISSVSLSPLRCGVVKWKFLLMEGTFYSRPCWKYELKCYHHVCKHLSIKYEIFENIFHFIEIFESLPLQRSQKLQKRSSSQKVVFIWSSSLFSHFPKLVSMKAHACSTKLGEQATRWVSMKTMHFLPFYVISNFANNASISIIFGPLESYAQRVLEKQIVFEIFRIHMVMHVHVVLEFSVQHFHRGRSSKNDRMAG